MGDNGTDKRHSRSSLVWLRAHRNGGHRRPMGTCSSGRTLLLLTVYLQCFSECMSAFANFQTSCCTGIPFRAKKFQHMYALSSRRCPSCCREIWCRVADCGRKKRKVIRPNHNRLNSSRKLVQHCKYSDVNLQSSANLII